MQFPFGTVTACRAFYHVHQTDPAGAVKLAKALFHAAFGEGRDICPVEALGAVAEANGFDAEDILTGIQGAPVKELLKREVEHAIGRGVFGSPFFMIDGEGFWGDDRVDEVAEWLDRGRMVSAAAVGTVHQAKVDFAALDQSRVVPGMRSAP
ncbi:MAG: DsbA family protein [Aliidongia sp.]